jgi:hypothetical protein
MNTIAFAPRWWLVGILGLAVAALGCDSEPEKPAKETAKSDVKQVKVDPNDPNVFLEVQGKTRRVVINGVVVLREGPLELLVTIKGKKEHEAILAADVDARNVHKALLAAGAEVGAPCRYQPKYVPATGAPIKITLQYEDKGKQVRVAANEWVRDSKSKKALASDWVFAGSKLVANPFDSEKPKIYLANEGDLICVSNFEDALLDLPINSSKNNDDLSFEANTKLIPEKETKVSIILEPILDQKK